MQQHSIFKHAATVAKSFVLFSLVLAVSACRDDDPQDACSTFDLTEVFVGEQITLTSCNQNVTDYLWSIYSNGAVTDLHGQTVTTTLSSAGTYKITLTVTDEKGTSSKSFYLTAKAGGTTLSGGTYSGFRNMEGVQLPNGNFFVYGLNGINPCQMILDNTFKQMKFSTEENGAFLDYAQSVVNKDRVLLCGRYYGLWIDTKELDFDGNIVWSKYNFPGQQGVSRGGPFVLLEGIHHGHILAESFRTKNDTVSYIHKMEGQGVAWSNEIVHTGNSTIRDAVVVDNQYVVLSVDHVLKKTFIDFVDDQGKIIGQKELALPIVEDYQHRSRLVYKDHTYVMAVLGNLGTNVYWFDERFNQLKALNITYPLVNGLYAIPEGYILFSDNFYAARIDNNGTLLSQGRFHETAVLTDVIKDHDGNFVMLGHFSLDTDLVGRIFLLRISPAGKVIE